MAFCVPIASMVTIAPSFTLIAGPPSRPSESISQISALTICDSALGHSGTAAGLGAKLPIQARNQSFQSFTAPFPGNLPHDLAGRSFRDPTTFGRKFSLFKPLRRQFQATHTVLAAETQPIAELKQENDNKPSRVGEGVSGHLFTFEGGHGHAAG